MGKREPTVSRDQLLLIIRGLQHENSKFKSQKAALLAACKLIGDEITDDLKKDVTPKGGVAIFLNLEQLEQIQSAIKAGEVK